MERNSFGNKIRATFIAASVIFAGGCVKNEMRPDMSDPNFAALSTGFATAYPTPGHPDCNIIVTDNGNLAQKAADMQRHIVVSAGCYNVENPPVGNTEARTIIKKLTHALWQRNEAFTQRDYNTPGTRSDFGTVLYVSPGTALNIWREKGLIADYRPNSNAHFKQFKPTP